MMETASLRPIRRHPPTARRRGLKGTGLRGAEKPRLELACPLRRRRIILTVGVQVDLPESSADSLPEELEPLTLSINSKGEIFIQESKVEYDKIIAKEI